MTPALGVGIYCVVGLVLVGVLFSQTDAEELHPGMFIGGVALWPVLLAIVVARWVGNRLGS